MQYVLSFAYEREYISPPINSKRQNARIQYVTTVATVKSVNFSTFFCAAKKARAPSADKTEAIKKYAPILGRKASPVNTAVITRAPSPI